MAMHLGITKKIIVTTLKCEFHTSTHCNGKTGRVMRKLMGAGPKRKKAFSEASILPTPNMFSKGSMEGRYSGNARRASVLNKLFMRNITDLMVTGEYASEFLSYGIEINRVQITPDYKGLNVFWVAKETHDESVTKVLNKNAGFLRHELSSLRVLGVVPTIYFVKDKKSSQLAEVSSRLTKADFGEDHVPVALETSLKTQLELHTPLPLHIKDKIYEIEQECPKDQLDISEDALPPMPQDVFGLNHAEILIKIGKSVQKSNATHRLNSNNELQPVQGVNENPIEFYSNKEQRAVFKSFLEKRQLLRSMIRKAERQGVRETELMLNENQDQHRVDGFIGLEFDEDDYCEDE